MSTNTELPEAKRLIKAIQQPMVDRALWIADAVIELHRQHKAVEALASESISNAQMVVKLQSLLDANISLNERLQAQLAAAQGQTKTRAEECRGYALLGTGQYCIKHTLDFDHELGAELLITLATDEDKSGNRQVGESRDDPEPGKPIQPEDMVIRIGFLSERGLFALEDQLAWIRKLHFAAAPIPQQVAQQAQPERAPSGIEFTADEKQALIELAELSGHSSDDFEPECPACTAWAKLTAALKQGGQHD